MKHAISARWLANPSHVLAICLTILAHKNILYSIKVNIRMLMKCLYRSPPPQSCWLLSLTCLGYFEHVVHFLLNTSFWCQFLDPHLITYHSDEGVQNITVQIRHVYLRALKHVLGRPRSIPSSWIIWEWSPWSHSWKPTTSQVASSHQSTPHCYLS